MPAAFQATLSGNPTPPTWAATTGFSTGDLVQPSTPTGQYFMAQQNGTTGSSEPGWSTPSALPVPGTVYPDGSTKWICVGSFVTATGAVVVDLPLDSDASIVAAVTRALKNLANTFLGIFAAANNWTGIQNFENGINCGDNGTNGTAGAFTGKNGTNDPGLTAIGGSTGIGVVANGGPIFGDGIWGVGTGGNSKGGRFFGIGTGVGGDFAGGSGGGDGISTIGGAGGNGISATGGSGQDGVHGTGGSGGGLGGNFKGTSAGAGIQSASESGVGALLSNSDDGAGAALLINPSASLPSAPSEGAIAYNGTTHHLEYYNGSAWVVL